MDEKKLHTREFQLKGIGYQQKHEVQFASEKDYWKNNRVFQTLKKYCH